MPETITMEHERIEVTSSLPCFRRLYGELRRSGCSSCEPSENYFYVNSPYPTVTACTPAYLLPAALSLPVGGD